MTLLLNKMEEFKPYTKKQIAKLKKYLNSKEFQIAQKNANEKANKIAKSMQFTWEEWSKIKDVPYM